MNWWTNSLYLCLVRLERSPDRFVADRVLCALERAFEVDGSALRQAGVSASRRPQHGVQVAIDDFGAGYSWLVTCSACHSTR
jgi:predicted signal transduction protein with EAL and GGDEF domain